MMYGTRKELNRNLKRMFGREERIALLIWTRQDVQALVAGMTPPEADAVLREIGGTGTGDHAEEGISHGTVKEIYAGLRVERPDVPVSVDMLERLTNIALEAIGGEDAKAWPLVKNYYPSVADAQADIVWLRGRIADE
ncbi:DUF1380 family protein [Erwinia amylovora]|uniref:DUF1380 family protein n=1 Tax=Erwinia amylovora TaxID=552 RepID=UPI001443BAE2|nr:DUF1380 family protein [Erwinia amylovora]